MLPDLILKILIGLLHVTWTGTYARCSHAGDASLLGWLGEYVHVVSLTGLIRKFPRRNCDAMCIRKFFLTNTMHVCNVYIFVIDAKET
jgi:hypothetical protein